MASPYWIVGPGRMGLAIGWVLVGQRALSELILVGRRQQPPAHPLLSAPAVRYSAGLPGRPPAGTRVILALPDAVIGRVATELADLGEAEDGCVALHLSGMQPATLLAPLASIGYRVGSLHPLQTVADPEHGKMRLQGAWFGFEGDPGARPAALEIVAAAHGRLLDLQARDKARYHAACVFAANYVVACAAVAARLLAGAVNIGRAEAVEALNPLWSGAVANLAELGLPRALTGPVARGDVETVQGQLAALDGATRALYGQLALEALELSRELGLDESVARAIEDAVTSSAAGGDAAR